jgi:endonuclease-3
LDETTVPVSHRLFQKGRTPQQIAALSLNELADVLYGSTFPHQKAGTILSVANKALEEYNGQLPPDFKVLTAIKGVGPNAPTLRWAWLQNRRRLV